MGLIKYEAEVTFGYLMDEELKDLEDLVNAELCGTPIPLSMAYKIPMKDICDDILNLKFSELIYNPQTQNPWVHGCPVKGMVIWLLPR